MQILIPLALALFSLALAALCGLICRIAASYGDWRTVAVMMLIGTINVAVFGWLAWVMLQG